MTKNIIKINSLNQIKTVTQKHRTLELARPDNTNPPLVPSMETSGNYAQKLQR
jgi:hypothetical protein